MITYVDTRLNAGIVNAGLFVCCLICFGGHPAYSELAKTPAEFEDYVGGIAFLLEGEVCLSRLNGGDISRLTQTDGEIRDFRFSPDLKYLACATAFGMVEAPGLWENEEEVPETEIWSIDIVNLITMTAVAEIEPQGDWLHFAKWFASDKLIYYSSSGFDISGYFQYDAETNTIETLDYFEGNRLAVADISVDGNQVLYVDDAGLGKDFHYRLHVLNLNTNDDRIIASRKRILNQGFSHDLKSVAFVEVQSNPDKPVAIVWIYNMENDETEKLITLPAKTKGNSSISWSSGDSCLGLFYAPSYRPNGYILTLADPSDVHELSGRQFSWVGDHTIVYSRGASDIFLYDLKDRKETLLIKKATSPAYLKRAN
jgi:WD40 repeat protein